MKGERRRGINARSWFYSTSFHGGGLWLHWSSFIETGK